MKKHHSFFADLLVSALICLCATTALAASGGISFNGAEVRLLGGYTVFHENEYLTTEAGAEIPSTLLYTDAAGETTCYVPIDAFSQALGMETKQAQDSPIVTVHLPYELMSYGLKTDMEGTRYGDVLEEIAPVPGVSGKTLLKETHYQEKDAVTTVMKPVRGNGDYVSITVTNHGKQALEFGIGTTKDANSIGSVLSQAPAGKTVTRTVKILDMSPSPSIWAACPESRRMLTRLSPPCSSKA